MVDQRGAGSCAKEEKAWRPGADASNVSRAGIEGLLARWSRADWRASPAGRSISNELRKRVGEAS